MDVYVRNITDGYINVEATRVASGEQIGPIQLTSGIQSLARQQLVEVTTSTASAGAVNTITSDANLTLSVVSDRVNQRHTGTLTANRTITLDTQRVYNGARFRVTRTGGGAFTLSVGGLKSLSQNQWCEVIYDGSAWVLMAYGTL